MEPSYEKTIDDIRYVMRPANALLAWQALKRAMTIFKDLSTQEGKIEIGTILQHLGTPEVEQIEKLIYEHTSVVIGEATPFKLSLSMDSHFNHYRGHIVPVLFAGVMYQFADFFPKALVSNALKLTNPMFQAAHPHE